MTAINVTAGSPLDSSDNSYQQFTDDVTETQSVALNNTPADFGNMNSLGWSVEYSLAVARTDDTYALGIRIVNGATILAAADSGGTFATVSSSVTSTTDTTTPGSGHTSFAYVNTTADKTAWDGASVELQQTYSKTKGADATHIRLDLAAFSGDYTIASTPTTVTLVADSLLITESTLSITAETEARVTLTADALTVTSGTLSINQAVAAEITLIPQSIAVTDGTLPITVGSSTTVSLIPQAITVSGGTLSVVAENETSVTLSPQSITVTGGTLGVTAGTNVSLIPQAITVSPGTLSVVAETETRITLTPQAITVSGGVLGIQAGGPVSVSLDPQAIAVSGGTLNVVHISDAVRRKGGGGHHKAIYQPRQQRIDELEEEIEALEEEIAESRELVRIKKARQEPKKAKAKQPVRLVQYENLMTRPVSQKVIQLDEKRLARLKREKSDIEALIALGIL